ncbi:MAG: YceI family protein [Flavobacteriales bacterium]|nr:YceI family protein [Flavobacteriales bacterium]MCC6937610.1 YceI family protein [Flavobacteriales bacterium]
MTIKQILLLAALPATFAFMAPAGKLVSRAVHIEFFSTTPAEDIRANNYTGTGAIDPASGDVVFSIPMQSFEFEKALMQKHFNSPDFLDTKAYPKAKFKGSIVDLGEVDFTKDGSYPLSVKGEMTIKDKTNPLTTTGTITVKVGKVSIESKFPIILADYGIAFIKGKPSTNVAKTVEVTVKGEFATE